MLYDPNIEPIYGENLSQAWAAALLKCYEVPGAILSPAAVCFPVRQEQELENIEIRRTVDKYLARSGKSILKTSIVNTIAGTIFPQSIWEHANEDRHKFFKMFREMIPNVRRCRANKRGHYFQRMIAYLPNANEDEPINQLEHIIQTWKKGNHRHSALQVGIFDPRVDHTNAPRQGFPCLQQVSFHASGSNGKDGLSVVAFYANQTVVEKAYGNYLGLYRLGMFMAKEMGIQLKEVVCIASALKLNNTAGKSCCKTLVHAIKPLVTTVNARN